MCIRDRDYAQRQMERAEQRENIVFTEKLKEQVLEYATMTGDDYDIRKMVRDLADAVRSSDEEKVDELMAKYVVKTMKLQELAQ